VGVIASNVLAAECEDKEKREAAGYLKGNAPNKLETSDRRYYLW
jgi:hypothetical protein